MKKIVYALIVLCLLGGGIMLANYLLIGGPVKNKLSADPRDKGIELSARYKAYVLPNVLVLNLDNTKDSHTQMDVLRCVLQASDALKDKTFKEVVLACRGTGKFKITGEYFKELGQTYDSQNPIYTLRTFAEHVLNMDGSKPYGSLEGGMLSVLSDEMDNFKDFSRKWYGNDLSADAE